MAFDTVLDLTESEVVDCLRVVVGHHQAIAASKKASAPAPEDAMDVDAEEPATQPTPAKGSPASSIPSLNLFLNLAVSYSTSRGPLLVALRRYLKDAQEITRILEVLSGWIKQKSTADENLMPTNKDLKKSEQGVWVVVGRKVHKRAPVPPLQKVSDFAL